MINQAVKDAINAQINNELYSSYAYLAMAAYCEHEQFVGCGKWLRMQSQEEHGHAMRLYDFLTARGGRVNLTAINAPQIEFKSVANVFVEAQKQEQTVTGQINRLYELAMKEKAFAALVELEWFITEQVEEEKTSREVVHKFEMVKDDPAALLDLDREMGGRTAVDLA
jgi:ferritin